MTDYKSLSHTRWECKYHVVFIPKYRKKAIYGQLRRELGEVLRRLAERRESRIEEGHLMPDHVHMMISIPPKYSVAQVVGYVKGKSAIHIARNFGERRRNFVGQHFWARGYFVSTVGRDEAVIREYIRHQEAEDRSARLGDLMPAGFESVGPRLLSSVLAGEAGVLEGGGEAVRRTDLFADSSRAPTKEWRPPGREERAVVTDGGLRAGLQYTRARVVTWRSEADGRSARDRRYCLLRFFDLGA